MTHFAKHSLTALAAIIMATASIGAIVIVPPAHANADTQIQVAMPELA